LLLIENTRSPCVTDMLPMDVITDPAVIPIVAVLIGIPTTKPLVLLNPSVTT
jgi:hypothetical protein